MTQVHAKNDRDEPKRTVVTSGFEAQPDYPQNRGYQEHQSKQGGKCCGFCCDYRRAVIICNIVMLVFNIIAVAVLATAGPKIYLGDPDTPEDDGFMDKYMITLIMAECVSCAFNFLAIYGAVQYKVTPVATAAAWIIAEYCIFVAVIIPLCNEWDDQDTAHVEYECDVNIGGFVVGAIIPFLWVYPHVFFIKEVVDGTMTIETYPREDYCCCG